MNGVRPEVDVYLPGDEEPPTLFDEPAAAIVQVGDDERRSWWPYDTRRPLDCRRSPAVFSQVGVAASAPAPHAVLGECVEVLRETVSVSTSEDGTYYPVGERDQRIREATEATVADLTRVIDELTTHRDRLVAELNEGDR